MRISGKGSRAETGKEVMQQKTAQGLKSCLTKPYTTADEVAASHRGPIEFGPLCLHNLEVRGLA